MQFILTFIFMLKLNFNINYCFLIAVHAFLLINVQVFL